MIRGERIVLRAIQDTDWAVIEEWGKDRAALWEESDLPGWKLARSGDLRVVAPDRSHRIVEVEDKRLYPDL